MKDIFSQNGECASSFHYKSPSNVPLMERTCAGKVFLTLKGKNLTGYIVDEVNDKWKIKLENDRCSTIWIKSLKYSPIDCKYLNDKCTVNLNEYIVDENYDKWNIKLEDDLCSTIWIKSSKY